MNMLYTAGYTGLKPSDFVALADRLNAIIADIRLSPYSRNPVWNKSSIMPLLGKRYLHIPTLGNRNYKGEYGTGIMIANMDDGTLDLVKLLDKQPVVILCMCAEYHNCHRNTVAEEMVARYDINVEHLSSAQISSGQKAPDQFSLF